MPFLVPTFVCTGFDTGTKALRFLHTILTVVCFVECIHFERQKVKDAYKDADIVKAKEVKQINIRIIIFFIPVGFVL